MYISLFYDVRQAYISLAFYGKPAIRAGKVKIMDNDKLKPWPTLPTDEAAEKFVEEADLSEYDWSLAEPVKMEFQGNNRRLTSPEHDSEDGDG